MKNIKNYLFLASGILCFSELHARTNLQQNLPLDMYKAQVRDQKSDELSAPKKKQGKKKEPEKKFTVWGQYYYTNFKDKMGITPIRGGYNYEFFGGHYKVKPTINLGGFVTLAQNWLKKNQNFRSAFGINQEIAVRSRQYEVGFTPYIGWQATQYLYIDGTFGVSHSNNIVKRNVVDENAGGAGAYTGGELITMATPKAHRISTSLFATYTRSFNKAYIQGQFGYSHSTMKRYAYTLMDTFQSLPDYIRRKTIVVGTISGTARVGYEVFRHVNAYIETGINSFTNKVHYTQEVENQEPRKRNALGYMYGAGLRYYPKNAFSTGIYAKQYKGHTKLTTNVFSIDFNVSF